MNSGYTLLGLPPDTLLIGGGLFLLSALLPTLISVLIRKWEERHHE